MGCCLLAALAIIGPRFVLVMLWLFSDYLSRAFGGGLMYGAGNGGFSLGLDYAYKYLGILGPTNFFSFTLGW